MLFRSVSQSRYPAVPYPHYLQLLEYHRKVNLEKGYGTADKNYKEKEEAEKQRNLTKFTQKKKENYYG